MFNFIRDGGAMSVIMYPGSIEGTKKRQKEFVEFLKDQNVAINRIESGAFQKSGTGISTVRLDFSNIQQPKDFDLNQDEDEDLAPQEMAESMSI
jgi:hypothetical protein